MADLRMSRAPASRGGYGPFPFAGTPAAGTNQVQTITFAGTGGTSVFRLNFEGQTTAPIPWSATNATLIASIKSALEALTKIGAGNTTVAAGTLTAGIGTVLVTFLGPNSNQNNTLLSLEPPITGTGPLTITFAITTPGVAATGQGAAKGALLIDTTTGNYYKNTGTSQSPAWGQMAFPLAEEAESKTSKKADTEEHTSKK